MSLTNLRPESNNPFTAVESCGHSQEQRPHCRWWLCIIISGSLVGLLGLVSLIVYLILQPHRPRFFLEDLTICDGVNDTSSSSLLARTLQVTVSSLNPNDRIGVVYDNLDVYASYRDRQFTRATALPPSYQGTHNDVVEWSPFLRGSAVTETPDMVASLEQDLTAGTVLFDVKVRGRVRWKVGAWLSTRYHIFVTCPAYVRLGKRSDGVVAGGSRGRQSCSLVVAIG